MLEVKNNQNNIKDKTDDFNRNSNNKGILCQHENFNDQYFQLIR